MPYMLMAFRMRILAGNLSILWNTSRYPLAPPPPEYGGPALAMGA